MKYRLHYLLGLLLLLSAKAKCQSKTDTVLIFPDTKDTISYSKIEFKGIIDKFPGLINERPDNPDISYLNRLCGLANKPDYDFSSEAGRDEYYMLYAYFLKSRDNNTGNRVMRRKLVSIFRDLNAINSELNHGGTYFGHQYSRILGYAEYEVHSYNLDSEYYNKSYSVNKQKKIFIDGLHQIVTDVVNNDRDVLVGQKVSRRKELYTIIDQIDKLITDSFYLKQAQRFLYSYY